MADLTVVSKLAAALQHHHPHLKADLWDIAGDPRCRTCRGMQNWTVHDPNREKPTDDDHPFLPTPSLVEQIARLRPLATSCINPGDGLRSPSLDGPGGSKGSVSRPTETTALNHVGRTHLTIGLADSLIRDATHALRLALSVATDPKENR